MPVVDVNFYSASLYRHASYKAIIPTAQLDDYPDGLPTLYLLHGLHGDETNWLYYTDIVRIAEKYNLAVVLPNGDNSFYVDQIDRRNYYGKLIGEELVRETRKLFPLSPKREHTFIGGLSMGGYGALRNGLKYASIFGAIVAFSSALLQGNIIRRQFQLDHPFAQQDFYEVTFGDIERFDENENNVEVLVKRLKSEGIPFPKLYIACGTDDFLLEPNRAFHRFLDELDIEHTYVESEGAHTWEYWAKAIEPAVRWLIRLIR